MKKFIYPALAFLPTLAFAQSLGNLPVLVTSIKTLINSILPVLLALAVLYFFWGLVTFIRASGSDPKAAEQGKTIMIWGIVALFVMVSIFGILNWLITLTGLNTGTGPTVPQVN